jgi:hypothetical protein
LATATASRAEEWVRARERGKEEESDFASSMGHNIEGIRVSKWLEVVGGACGRGKLRRGRNPRAAAVRTRQQGHDADGAVGQRPGRVR